MPKLKGYMHPSGMLTLRKNRSTLDLYPTEVKITGVEQNLIKMMLREGFAPSPPTVEQKKNRSYRSGKSIRRKILNASHVLHYKCKHKPCFISLTFPRCPGKNIKKMQKAWADLPRAKRLKTKKPTENYYIRRFVNYITDKTKSIKAGGYWWVKELQERGVIHYHLLIDMQFVEAQRLNSIWCNIIKQRSKNALHIRLQSKNIRKLCSYVTKYCSKSENVFSSRAYSISNDINLRQIPIFNNSFIDKQIENISKKAKQTENTVFEGEFWDFAYVPGELATKIYFELLDFNKKYI